jgi:hypothetical protein
MLVSDITRNTVQPVVIDRGTDKLRGLENAALQHAKLDKTRGPALLMLGREEAGLAVIVELGREKAEVKAYRPPAMRAYGLASPAQEEPPTAPPAPVVTEEEATPGREREGPAE